ncbi:PRPX-like protein, partial [Mya arenaria]
DMEPTRDYMDGADITWRHEKPNYDDINRKYMKEKQRNHAEGSLEKTVENLVKTWEMESSHKMDEKKFTLEDNIKLGNYNILMADSPLYDASITNQQSHDIFRTALPGGFAWEVLDVYSGPPDVSFTWRHWGNWEGHYNEVPPTGENIEMIGHCVARVTDQLKIQSIDHLSANSISSKDGQTRLGTKKPAGPTPRGTWRPNKGSTEMVRPAWVPRNQPDPPQEGHGVRTRAQQRAQEGRRRIMRRRQLTRQARPEPAMPPRPQPLDIQQRIFHRLRDLRPRRNIEHESMVLRSMRVIPGPYDVTGSLQPSRPRNQPRTKRLTRTHGHNASVDQDMARRYIRELETELGARRAASLEVTTTMTSTVHDDQPGTSGLQNGSNEV